MSDIERQLSKGLEEVMRTLEGWRSLAINRRISRDQLKKSSKALEVENARLVKENADLLAEVRRMGRRM